MAKYIEDSIRESILEGIRRGERAIRDGKVMTHEEVKKSLSKWLEPKAEHTHPQL